MDVGPSYAALAALVAVLAPVVPAVGVPVVAGSAAPMSGVATTVQSPDVPGSAAPTPGVATVVPAVGVPGGAGVRSPASRPIVVDDDGPSDYDSVAAAAAAVDPGGRILVRNGTYRRPVVVEVPVRIDAARNAVLDGNGTAKPGIEVRTDGPVTVTGLTVREFRTGLRNRGGAAVVLRNLTVARNRADGVATAGSADLRVVDCRIHHNGANGVEVAIGADDDVTVRRSTLYGNDDAAVAGQGSLGNWTLEDVVVYREGSGDVTGVDGSNSGGDWTLRNVTVLVGRAGVDGSGSTGDWRLSNVTVGGATDGVLARSARGDWTLDGVTVAHNRRVGVDARNASGRVRIRRSNVLGNGRAGVAGAAAERPVTATGVWWGRPDGPVGAQCTRNVDCGDHRRRPVPVAGPVEVDTRVPAGEAPRGTVTYRGSDGRRSGRRRSTTGDSGRASAVGGPTLVVFGGAFALAVLFAVWVLAYRRLD